MKGNCLLWISLQELSISDVQFGSIKAFSEVACVFVCRWRRWSFATAWRCADVTKLVTNCGTQIQQWSCGVLCQAQPEDEGTNRKGSKDNARAPNVVWIKADFSCSLIRISKSFGVNSSFLCLQVDFTEERPATDLYSFACLNQWPCISHFPSPTLSLGQESFVFKMGPSPAFKFTSLRNCSV